MSAVPRLHQVLGRGQAAGLDGEYASDHWHAARLGVPARRGRAAARFDAITQGWLREAVKRWSRLRLVTGCAFAAIGAGALAMSRFSAFLAGRHPGITSEAGITRPVLEGYLSWLLDQGYSAPIRALTLSMLRVFTEACHRHGWLPELAPGAVIYVEELSPHHGQVARVHPRVRDGPARIRAGAGEDPAYHHPPPRGGPHGDRAARRGRVHAAVQPGARRQRRLAVSAV